MQVLTSSEVAKRIEGGHAELEGIAAPFGGPGCEGHAADVLSALLMSPAITSKTLFVFASAGDTLRGYEVTAAEEQSATYILEAAAGISHGRQGGTVKFYTGKTPACRVPQRLNEHLSGASNSASIMREYRRRAEALGGGEVAPFTASVIFFGTGDRGQEFTIPASSTRKSARYAGLEGYVKVVVKDAGRMVSWVKKSLQA